MSSRVRPSSRGRMDASITRRPSRPRTRSRSSTTDMPSWRHPAGLHRVEDGGAQIARRSSQPESRAGTRKAIPIILRQSPKGRKLRVSKQPLQVRKVLCVARRRSGGDGNRFQVQEVARRNDMKEVRANPDQRRAGGKLDRGERKSNSRSARRPVCGFWKNALVGVSICRRAAAARRFANRRGDVAVFVHAGG